MRQNEVITLSVAEITEVSNDFQLLTQRQKEQVDAVIPVSWCISRETAERLQKMDADGIYVLIVIENEGEEIDRYVVSADEPMSYIQFRRPGKNVVHGTLVWRSRQKKDPRRVLTNRNDQGGYAAVVLDSRQPRVAALEELYDDLDNQRDEEDDEKKKEELTERMNDLYGELRRLRDTEPREYHIQARFDSLWRLEAEDSFEVVVPEEMFAKSWRLTTWLGTYYNIWESKARDQCQLRRRAYLWTIWTLPFYWTVLVFGAVVGTIILELYYLSLIALGLLMGMRNLSILEPLRHPWDSGWGEVMDKSNSSIWTSKAVDKDGEIRYVDRHPFFMFVNPATVTLCAVLGWSVYSLFSLASFWVFVAVGVPFALGLLVLAVSFVTRGWVEKRRELKAAWADARRKAERETQERAKRQLSRQLELLACENRPEAVSYEAVPKERRTVTLRYQHTKAKLCKPFAAR